jgi:hypothetical protein
MIVQCGNPRHRTKVRRKQRRCGSYIGTASKPAPRRREADAVAPAAEDAVKAWFANDIRPERSNSNPIGAVGGHDPSSIGH